VWDYFFTDLWNFCGFGDWEWSGGVDGGAGGIGWRVIKFNVSWHGIRVGYRIEAQKLSLL